MRQNEIGVRVDTYIQALESEMRQNEELIAEGNVIDGDPNAQHASSIEASRRQIDSDGSCSSTFFEQITAPVNAHCNFSAVDQSCSHFNNLSEVEGILTRADQAIGRVSSNPSVTPSATCENLNLALTELTQTREALFNSRTEASNMHRQIADGNRSCAQSVSENISNDMCTDSMRLDAGKSSIVHNLLVESARTRCFTSSMSSLKLQLNTFFAEKAQATCNILNSAFEAGRGERDLFNKTRQLDLSISQIDEVLTSVTDLSTQMSCQAVSLNN